MRQSTKTGDINCVIGLRITGTSLDAAAIRTLAELAAPLVSSLWIDITSVGRSQHLLVSKQLDASQVKSLVDAGLDIVEIADDPSRPATIKLTSRSNGEQVEWTSVSLRAAPNLLEAIQPHRVHGDPIASDACFLVSLSTPGGRATLERLLLLGRDDVAVAELREGETKQLAIFVPSPPLYLLMRSRDEQEEGISAYVRVAGDVWVAWGYAHPLLERASGLIALGDHSVFVDASGRWRFAPAKLTTRGIFDAIAPELSGRRQTLEATPGEQRFRIPLRLDSGPEVEPEMWLLTSDQLLNLEPMLEASAPDDLSRLTVARLTGTQGITYVMRELIRPGLTRVGLRVSQSLNLRGFSRALGVDNLFLPVGRRLVPAIRRDDLRALLKLDEAELVIIDEDFDGPRIISVMSMSEAPISRWIDYVATDRRAELERMLERSVFAFPELEVEVAPEARVEGEKREERDEAPRARTPREPRRKPAPVVAATSEEGVDAQEVARRARARELEREVSRGGCEQADVWGELAILKGQLKEHDEAALCLEASMFFGGRPDPELAKRLVGYRAHLVEAAGTAEEIVDLATRDDITPVQGAYLGARALEMVRHGEVSLEALVQQLETRFTDPMLPVPRKLAWLVLSACHRRSGDTLGMTRAKEKILGAINDRGLSETLDVPRFVRAVLALEGPSATSSTSAPIGQSAQVEPLERLWIRVQNKGLPELDVRSGYLRVSFAMGFVRLGQTSRAHELTKTLENELSVHEIPNRALYRLYMARIAHVGTGADDAQWAPTVESLLKSVPDDRMRERVEWLRRRSGWLNPNPPEEPRPWIRAPLERLLSTMERAPQSAPDVLRQSFAMRELFDYEVTSAIERTLRSALRTGVDALIDETREVAYTGVDRIRIPGHRARALGACVSAAATAGDGDTVDRLLDEVVAVASGRNVPSIRDLLTAVQPALDALRRVGVGHSGQRFLEALMPVADTPRKERVLLRAALADGFLQIGQPQVASDLLDRALNEVLEGITDHVMRYEGAVAVLEALKHWPFAERIPRSEAILDALDRFLDTFTVSRYYRTHQVLVSERLIDAIVDQTTFRQDVIKGYLFAEEQALRRRILADWRDACGRLKSSSQRSTRSVLASIATAAHSTSTSSGAPKRSISRPFARVHKSRCSLSVSPARAKAISS
ncbi:MAG: hypothetical protein U0165_18625 [Polyangiaceae bacterium]